MFGRYYALLALPNPDPVQQRLIAEVQEQLRARRYLGTTFGRSLMYEAIDRLVAEHKLAPVRTIPSSSRRRSTGSPGSGQRTSPRPRRHDPGRPRAPPPRSSPRSQRRSSGPRDGSMLTLAERSWSGRGSRFERPGNYAKEAEAHQEELRVSRSTRTATPLLALVFRKKCAYCESRFAHVTPKDIEHFRPKRRSRPSRGPGPGYYWLAASGTTCWSLPRLQPARKHSVR